MRRITALEAEVEQLKRAIASHAVVDQAIGVVVAWSGLRPESAWQVLRETSQHTNTKLREVAEYVVQWPRCEWLPPGIREAVGDALERAKRAPHPLPPPGDGL